MTLHRMTGRPAVHATRATRAAFTLVELVVVVIVIAILAALAAVAYNRFIVLAQDARAVSQLRDISKMATIAAAMNGVYETVTYTSYNQGLQTFPDVAPSPGPTAAGAGWRLLSPTTPPVSDHDFSLAFDDGMGTNVSALAGQRAVAVTRSGSGRFFAVLVLAAPGGADAPPQPFEVPRGASASDVLGGAVTPGDALPYSGPSTSTPTTSAPAAGPTPSATPSRDPATDPVTITPAPQIDWTTCSSATATGTRASVTDAKIATQGNSNVWWNLPSAANVVGFKICSAGGGGSYTLVASTGPGTASTRMWSVRTNQAHPGVFLAVITVFNDGHESTSTNTCEVAPAGAANGWQNQGRGC